MFRAKNVVMAIVAFAGLAVSASTASAYGPVRFVVARPVVRAPFVAVRAARVVAPPYGPAFAPRVYIAPRPVIVQPHMYVAPYGDVYYGY